MSTTQSADSLISVDLHGLRLDFQSPDVSLRQSFEAVYGHLAQPAESSQAVRLSWRLHQLPLAPQPPAELSLIAPGEQVSYYGAEQLVAIRLPKYGLLTVDLQNSSVEGQVTRNCLEVYGAFEDVMMISLAPLYRRRGWFPLHAFAALSPGGQVALITGPMGSGKTTTGLALLCAGWKLLSNDSPLLTTWENRVQVLAYPGRLSVFDDSLTRFERLKRFIPAETVPVKSPQKRVFVAEAAFSEPWASSGRADGVFLPQIVPGLECSELLPITPKEALLQLIPLAVEGWDKPYIAPSLQLLNQLVEQAPCYILKLSPHVAQLPELIGRGLSNSLLKAQPPV